MKILLIEDEIKMAEALSELLRLEKYKVDICTDGLSGLELIQYNDYDILIMDVMLPVISGFEIAKKTRQLGITTPILMLTAKSEIDDKVMGLDSGADDYLTKPFNTKELLARLRALSRRNNEPDVEILSFGDISLNPNTFQLCCTANGQSVRLSKKEYRIMEIFILNKNQVLSREQLALKIWGYENEAEYNNVEVYISFTRKKLNFINSRVEIKSLRGLGYELRYNDV